MIPNLKPNSVVVVDNAPYHNVQVEIVPNASSRKAVIQQWLEKHGILYDADSLKVELLKLIRQNKPEKVRYKIDEIFEASGHSVLRLPPYHPILNPIENIWGQVKGRVAKQNVSQKLKDVKVLAEEEFAKVTVEDWRKTCRYFIIIFSISRYI